MIKGSDCAGQNFTTNLIFINIINILMEPIDRANVILNRITKINLTSLQERQINEIIYTLTWYKWCKISSRDYEFSRSMKIFRIYANVKVFLDKRFILMYNKQLKNTFSN